MNKDNLRIAVLGAGRMGSEVLQAISADARLEVAGVWTRGKHIESVLESGDVAVDFTLPSATPQIIDAVVRLHKPLVCGVSGLGDDIMARMRAASSSVPILHDRNMSLGIAVLTELVRRAGAALGAEFVAGIHETHHVHKIDAPSGTALALGEALAHARGKDWESVYRYDEKQPVERSSPDEIVFSVTREGENPGEHTVAFRSEAETLELAHRVRDRRVFALGALQAARWLVRQQPGFYGMRDLAAPGEGGRSR